MKFLCSVVFLSIIFSNCKINRKIDYTNLNKDRSSYLLKADFDSIIGVINEIHPSCFGNLQKSYIDSLVAITVSKNEGKILSLCDWTFQLRKVLDRLTENDPHLIVVPILNFNEDVGLKYDKIKVLPFEMLQINDTILVGKTYNRKIRCGDRILSINGIDIKDLQRYSYSNLRYFPGYMLQAQAHFVFSPIYNINVERDKVQLNLEIKGISLEDYGNGDPFINTKLFDKFRVGYVRINQFNNNKYIINKISLQIDKTKKKGFNSIIIDIRNNPGGSGYLFDDLLSLFTNKDSLRYMHNQKLKISPISLNDYKFLEDSIGKLVSIPDSLIFHNIFLNKEYYKGNMNYYVLMDRSTESVASSFANVLQYNNIVKLVGEPLNHNATKFGDVEIKALMGKINIILSTMEYNEYTNREDGVVYPDIYIPYIASEYMKGGDPILEKLLNEISKN